MKPIVKPGRSMKPIIHPDRNIGDAREIVPGNRVGDRGPLTEIIHTWGGDGASQVLTVSIMGSGVFGSSVSGDPRGPLFATIEWGVRGARAIAEVDIPLGGATFTIVASDVRVLARYDGLVIVNGAQLDPVAVGAPNPGPRQRVAAMIGYGSYHQPTPLTRTVRLDDLEPVGIDPGTGATVPVRRPAFGRRVLVTGAGIQRTSYVVRFGGLNQTSRLDEITFNVGDVPRVLDLPGDTAFVDVLNNGPVTVGTPALTFEVAF